MPQAVAIFIAVGTAVGFVGTAALIVGGIITIGAIYLAQKALMPEPPQSISGTLLNKEGSSVPIPVIYGKRRVGGHRTFLASNGPENKNLHIIFTMCEGTIHAVDNIWFNDELAASSADNGATWTYHNGYEGHFTVQAFKGDQTTACAALVAENLGWTAAHVGLGVAYLYIRVIYNADVYDSGLPDITATIRGKVVNNPFTNTMVYSTNPALIINDYMTNTFYGKGIAADLIVTDSLQSAYNYYDTIVTNSDSSTEKRYEIHASVDTEQKMFDNLAELLLACRSSIVTAEKYQLLPDRPLNTNGLYEINDDMIIGNIAFMQANKRTLLNEIRAKFPDEDSADYNYKENFVIVKSPALQASDGVKLKMDIEMRHTTSGTMVERIITEEINQSRQSGILTLVTTTQLMETTVGDIVSFTNDTLNQNGKLYRIIGQVLTADHTMELKLKEYDPAVYWDNNQGIIINNKDDTDF